VPGGGETWFRSLADMSALAIFVFRDKILYTNQAGEQLSGYPRDELASRSFWSLLHPDDRSRTREAWKASKAAKRRLGRMELRLHRRSGEERWIDLTASAIEILGRPATVGTAFDITERKLAELALATSEERLELAHRAARSLSWEWDPETDGLTFSEYANELLGFAVGDLIRTGEQFRRYVHVDDQDRLNRALMRTLKGGGDLSVEIRCISPNGTVRWLAEKALAVRDEKGWTTKVIGVAHDITERKIAEEALFQEKERALVTLASIADGVIRTDSRGTIDYLNPVARQLTGWTMAEAYGRPVGDVYRVVDDAGGQPSLNPVDRCLKEERNIVYPGDRRLVRKDGARFSIHDSAAPIRNRHGQIIGAILVFKDLTQLRRVEQEMVHLASHDPLTGLINRREFEARAGESLRGVRLDGRTAALCYLDLDEFKLVNDTCGPTAGDQMILQIAGQISTTLEPGDVLARLGGDEFGILMPDRPLEQARTTAERVAQTVARYRFSWQDRIFSISVSGGLVALSADLHDFATVMSAADAACYVAKERGGGRIHEYEPGDQAIAERYGQMQWISRIHKALDERRFCIFQQRIVPLRDLTQPTFCELFIRLRDGSGKIVEPESFIPAAERYGLITSIDRWMVHAALSHLSEQSRGGVNWRFAINLSGQSLSDQSFLRFVITQFDRSRVPPECILFEITETSAIGDLPRAMRFMSTLREMGCRFVLDDFGKGLSSFGYLKNLPVDFLKIDGQFVRDLTQDRIQRALVASIHDIGQVMGLQTIAESVETEETLDALRNIGVDYVQGFLLARPEPLELDSGISSRLTDERQTDSA
jgi:diguanylate cyclase (GGDEF)-like protein/PAS domain S-box-containing protein